MKNNLLKFGLLVLLAVFTFHSCSDDEQVISPKSVDSIKITIEDKIDNEELNNKIGQDLLKIRQAFQINTTNHKGENYQKKTENDSISIEDIEINIEAFNVIENENGKASYTFEVDFPLNNLDSQEIINLHFYYDENNQLKRQLIKYELSNEELQTVIENQSFDGFWDRISYSNLDDLETTPNSEKITAARSSDPCSCKSKKSTVKWKTPYSNNSGYGGYSSGTGGSGGQTPFSVIPISLQKLWGIAPASAYYPGPNYVGPTCNCNYTIPVRYFSVGDLTIPNTNSNSTPTPFNRRYFYYFPELKNKITTYYNQVYVSYINSYMTSTQTTLEDHNNKQRFITQFFKFLYKLRTENYSAFNYLANNPQKTVAVFNFLAENNSFNDYEFAKSAITALMNSGEVDWVNEVILDESFVNNEKAKCAYDKLTADDSPLFRDTVGAFIDDPEFKLTFKVGNCSNTDDACTNTTDPNNIVIIIEDVNITPVEMAQFILHEAIHAEIARYVAQYQSGVDVNDRPYLFELYKHYKELYDSGDIDHIYMTLNYINPINAALRVFDDNNFPSNYYSSFTWDGLRFWDAGDLLSIEEDEANALRRIEVIENSSACE